MLTLIRRHTHPLAGVMLALPILCQASGSLPIPESKQSYPSFNACVEALKTQYLADQQRVSALQTLPEGRTRQISLESKGVQVFGKDKAGYDATLWYHNGAPRADLQQMEVSHSFEERGYECQGPQMILRGRNGYTLSTFEPMSQPQ
ncbi:hypothetical protein [Leeia aquatica]|uniref:Uncharacterized protein n=1 Tax=Leeia aquatica TaxID=2725557 RepID=A0A847SDN2_9NEIS|nr:hypothetical protein [Leeia aquatica]NLR75546.1 hypothetical protein [Leeia aquatica]